MDGRAQQRLFALIADRVRRRIGEHPDLVEKEMFGGIAFMIGGRMAIGVSRDELMVRVGKDAHDEAVARPGARIMDFTSRPMRGWITVAPEGFGAEAELDAWAVAMGSDMKRSVKG